MKTLLLGIDTLRADHLGCYGYPRPTSPHIDAMASEGTVFLNNSSAYSFTLPSFTSMITGNHPLNHRIVMNPHSQPNMNTMMLDDLMPTLAELFWDNGQVTCSVDNLFNFWSHPKWFIRGYQYTINATMTSLPRHGRVRADEINALLFPWLRANADEDFFLFVHYWDPHGPYEAPDPKFRDMYSPRQLEDLPVSTAPSGQEWVLGAGPKKLLGEEERLKVSRYDGEITFLDDRLSRLFGLLKELGIYDDMTIMLVSDHGDVMVEREQTFAHRGMWHPTHRTPMIVKPPKGAIPNAPATHDALVSNVDILPTLCDLAGISLERPVDGRSLLPLMRGEVAQVRGAQFAEGTYPHHGMPARSLRVGDWKIIRFMPEFIPPKGDPNGLKLNGQPYWPDTLIELYDLGSDPFETVNVAADRPAKTLEMLAALDAWIADHRAYPAASDPFSILMSYWHLPGAIF